MNIKTVRENIAMSKKLLIHEIENTDQSIRTMNDISVIGEELINENKRELQKAERDIKTIIETVCKEEKEELRRPPECP